MTSRLDVQVRGSQPQGDPQPAVPVLIGTAASYLQAHVSPLTLVTDPSLIADNQSMTSAACQTTGLVKVSCRHDV